MMSWPAVALGAILACCLGRNLPSASAAPGSWTRKADIPMALDTHASCEVDGILYVIGGHKDPGIYTQLPTLFAYDPKTDSWTRKADMPTARRWPAACAVDGIIYVIGGGGMFGPVTNVVEAYDPKTDTWVPKARLSSSRSFLAACAVDGIIYAIGGGTGATMGGLNRLAKVEAYDPKTDRWTPKASLPIPMWWHAASAVNGLIYVFFLKDTFAYDPKADRWTRKALIPVSSLDSLYSASSEVDGIIYLFGGSSTDGWTTYNLSLAYDPAQDAFTTSKRKIPVTCEAAAAATIGGKIYHSGGANQDPVIHPVGAVYYDSLWVFDPRGGVAPEISGLTIESTNRVRLAWQGELGRLYRVQSTTNLVSKYAWTQLTFSTGTNTLPATNELVEATCLVPSGDTNRFFRVLEAN